MYGSDSCFSSVSQECCPSCVSVGSAVYPIEGYSFVYSVPADSVVYPEYPYNND
jgi:hypothetical protein